MNLAENGFPDPRSLLISLFFQPALVDFSSVYSAGSRGSNPEPDLIPFDSNDGDGDAVINHDLLADFAGKYQHDKPPCSSRRWIRVCVGQRNYEPILELRKSGKRGFPNLSSPVSL